MGFSVLGGNQRERDVYNALDRSQAMIEFKLDGTIVTANKNFLDTLGYTLDEVKGRHHSIFVDPAEASGAEYKEFWASLRRGEFRSAEYRRVGKGGKDVWIQASYNPLLDSSGQPYGVFKIASDITAQKLASADNAGQIEAINRSQAVIHFDLDGTIRDANENFCSALGYSLAEIKGKHHSMFVANDDRGSAYDRFWEKLRNGEFQTAEYRRIGKGGKEIWIQASYNPIFDMSGNPFKVVKYATDITGEVEDRMRRAEIQRIIDADLSEVQASVASAVEQAEMAASASTQTSANVESVAAGGEELSASINQISEQVSEASAVSADAVARASKASEIIAGLSTAAQSIGEVVNMISDIADQTNLLALNATIEAARAGEMGKGFAVVAGEVKVLANQSTKATGQINEQISGVQAATQQAVEAIDAISEVIEKVNEISTAIAGAVEEQAAVTQDISSNMQEATTAVSSISENISQIATATQIVKEGTDKVKTASASLA